MRKEKTIKKIRKKKSGVNEEDNINWVFVRILSLFSPFLCNK